MAISSDAPSLDVASKLVSYQGEGRLKLSPGKELLPCAKQVFRLEENGVAAGDVVARFDETLPGRPLLIPVMRAGRRCRPPSRSSASAFRAREEVGRLPAALRRLSPPELPYPPKRGPVRCASVPKSLPRSDGGRGALLDRADHRNHVGAAQAKSLGLTIEGVARVDER